MRYFIIFVSALLLILGIVPLVTSSAEQEVCEQVVQTALEQANEVCTGTGRNQACYGHTSLIAQPQSRFEPFNFDEAGDIINVTQLKSLRLSPMDVTTGTWGVAMMSLQANLSEENPAENVTLVLFGDVEIDNAIAAPTAMDVTVRSSGNANVRREPSDNGFVLGTLAPGQIVNATGRTADSTWFYIDFPGADERGWINSQLIDAPGEANELNVMNPSLIEYGPMQAFYVRTGDQNSTCEEAPNDGLLIQTPEGAGEVRLWINEVKIRLGSTIFIQAPPNQNMSISTLEGEAHVEAFGVEQTAVAGTTVSVPLDIDSKPMAPPKPPERYTEEVVNHLPVENLEEVITVVPPAILESTPTEAATEAQLPTETATDIPVLTSTATEIFTDIPSETPTETPLLPTETATDEATSEVSQTQEPSNNEAGDETSSETATPNETPSDESQPTKEPDTVATDEVSAESFVPTDEVVNEPAP
jgi:uncharacterized protein YraI